MKRILLMSDAYSINTGYGNVFRHISQYLSSTGKYEIAYLSWFFNHEMRKEFGTPPFIEYSTFKMHDRNCCGRDKVIEEYHPDGKVKYYKMEGGVALLELPNDRQVCLNNNVMEHDRYAYESLPAIIQHFKPDIVMTLGDIWMAYHTQFMPHRKSYKWIMYNAIDSTPTPHMTEQGNQKINWMTTFKNADKYVGFCNFNLNSVNKTAEKYGYDKISDKYIWHGTDLNIFKPLSKEIRQELRKKIFNIDDNTFLVGFFSRNQPRKALHKVFEAIRIFKDKGYETGKKVKVYFHCPIHDLGWNLENLISWYNLQDTIILNKDLKIGAGVSEDMLNKLYNVCDIITLPSRGEGWSLCTSDAICAGVPNLISDYSAHADWAREAGVMYIDILAMDAEPITNQERAIVDTNDYADKLKILYDNKDNIIEKLTEKNIEFRQKLSWNRIGKEWEELLDNIDISKNEKYKEIIYKPIDYIISTIPSDPINIEFKLTEI